MKKALSLLFSVVLCLCVIPFGGFAPEVGAVKYSTEEATAIRKGILEYFYAMATVKWTCGESFTVDVDGVKQTYYKNQVYYGIPYAQKAGSSIVTREAYEREIAKTGGKVSRFLGQSDCSNTVGTSYRKHIPTAYQIWTVSAYEDGEHGFEKLDSFAELLPGDVVVSAHNHAMMVVSVDKANETLVLTHQTGAFHTYDPKTDTTAATLTTMKKRNTSWVVNQEKTFSALKSERCLAYRFTELGDKYDPDLNFTYSLGASGLYTAKRIYNPSVETVKLSAYTYTYNGKVKTPSVIATDSEGNTLKKDVDYTVKYASGRKMPGKYKVTITFKGKYSGKKTFTFKIIPATNKITKATSTKKGTVNLTWSDITGETGYQVYYSAKKDSGFKRFGTYKANVTSASKSKLTSGKTYYFKVRAYKSTSSGNIYSVCSALKAVKIT